MKNKLRTSASIPTLELKVEPIPKKKPKKDKKPFMERYGLPIFAIVIITGWVTNWFRGFDEIVAFAIGIYLIPMAFLKLLDKARHYPFKEKLYSNANPVAGWIIIGTWCIVCIAYLFGIGWAMYNGYWH